MGIEHQPPLNVPTEELVKQYMQVLHAAKVAGATAERAAVVAYLLRIGAKDQALLIEEGHHIQHLAIERDRKQAAEYIRGRAAYYADVELIDIAGTLLNVAQDIEVGDHES